MFEVRGTTITLTRGDTLVLNVLMRDKQTKQEYIPSQGDVIRFALKHQTMKPDRTDYTDEQPLILKNIPIDTQQLVLLPNDTKNLGFGAYVYDIEITMSDGTVDTFIQNATFVLTPEVY